DILDPPPPDAEDAAAALTTKTTKVASGGGGDGAGAVATAAADAGADEAVGGKEITFCVRNQGSFPCRFLFANHKHFKFSPSVGHLPVGSRREIR
ncbi:unnamed protein product, partial [Ectocarpus sp. 8 AP-2014]